MVWAKINKGIFSSKFHPLAFPEILINCYRTLYMYNPYISVNVKKITQSSVVKKLSIPNQTLRNLGWTLAEVIFVAISFLHFIYKMLIASKLTIEN